MKHQNIEQYPKVTCVIIKTQFGIFGYMIDQKSIKKETKSNFNDLEHLLKMLNKLSKLLPAKYHAHVFILGFLYFFYL